MNEIENEEKKKIKKPREKKNEQQKKETEPSQETTHSDAVMKMKLVSALSTACTQKIIIEAFSKIEFGEQLLESVYGVELHWLQFGIQATH